MSIVRFRDGLPWLVTVLLAVAVLATVTAWVRSDGIDRGEALKTGGLAAGSVIALYALWLNDRRRRVEEQRQEIERGRQELETARYALEQSRQALEHQRAEHDRARVADERFARAVELLGHDTDQVRVGALHALAGLARSRPAYTQTVLDVLCSYLRRPFDHYRFAAIRSEKTPTDESRTGKEWTDDERAEADRWLQVRLTAQRLIYDLLSPVSEPDAPVYDLDLHGATLEYFDLRDRKVGQLRAREMNLYMSTMLRGAVVHGGAWLTGTHSWGRFFARGTVFHDLAWFSKFEAAERVEFTGSRFLGETNFANTVFRDEVSFADVEFDRAVDFGNARFEAQLDLRVAGGATANTRAMRVSLEHETNLPDGWSVDTTRGTPFGLVRA
ncbi:MAG TPA: pentapeptide repeat-containing protein [Actinophytocola sp.]|uniref:pentapeptide repeat-containing protein n=1 Tax=Actinophytocola sp. TaxID=1872138 RepID=UPI002DB5F779|nr:pentapeptide repeat-containing protein [Actinophytocola sp.]HEU5474092.1 pentapeptide repeat-containing protein [Actinophytocola sp.]